MVSEQFLWLSQEVELVLGARRAALYDFESGHVFSLNPPAREVLTRLLAGEPVSAWGATESTFVQNLVNHGLAAIESTPFKSLQRERNDPSFRPRLKFLWLELTDSCNLRCVHCYMNATHVSAFKNRPTNMRPALTTENWVRVIQEGAELGCHAVQFTGGEPLLHPDLLFLIDIARQLEYSYIEVFTNGTLLNEQLAAELKARNVNLAVSLHSTDAPTHDAITLVPGSHVRAQHGAQVISEYDIPVRYGTTTLRTNQNKISSSMSQSLRENNVVRPIGRGANKNLSPDEPQIVESVMKRAPDFQTSRVSFEYARRWNICWAGKIAITAFGDAIPCVFGREQIVGNVETQSLSEIVSNPNLQSLWGLNKDHVEICRDCEYRYACSDCRPLAEKFNGTLDAKTARCMYDPHRGKWLNPDGTVASIDDNSREDSPVIHSVTKTFLLKDPFHRSEDECDPDRPANGQEDFEFAFCESAANYSP